MNVDEKLHIAIEDLGEESEIAVKWVVGVEFLRTDGSRRLHLQSGTGYEGQQATEPWELLGIVEAMSVSAKKMVEDNFSGPDDN